MFSSVQSIILKDGNIIQIYYCGVQFASNLVFSRNLKQFPDAKEEKISEEKKSLKAKIKILHTKLTNATLILHRKFKFCKSQHHFVYKAIVKWRDVTFCHFQIKMQQKDELSLHTHSSTACCELYIINGI